MENKTETKNRRLMGLDGLRAIAILGVVFYHILPQNVSGGFLGVNAFFVIMGYLMVYTAKSAVNEKTFRGFLTQYYKKKLLRLYPPLLLMLAISLILLLLFIPDYGKGTASEIASVLLGYNNWFQIFQNASYFERMMNSSPFTHLWYLGLTMQYYLLWPFLFLLGGIILYGLDTRTKSQRGGRYTVMAVLVILTAASAIEMAVMYDPNVDPSRIYYGTDTRAFSLTMGMFIGLLPIGRIRKKLGKTVRFSILPTLVCLALIIFEYLVADGGDGATYHYRMLLSSLLFSVILLLSLLNQKRVGRWLDIVPLKQLGVYSYEIYLVMYPVIYFVQRKFPTMMAERKWLYVLLCLLGIAAFAAVLHFIPVLWQKFQEDHEVNVWIKRAAPALLLIVCVLLTGTQTHLAKTNGGADDFAEMQKQIEESESSLSDNNAFQLAAMLSEQLSSVSVNTNLQTNQVAEAAKIRKNARTAAEAQRALEQQAQPVAAIPAVVSATAIGDSVMLGASGALQSAIPGCYVDAAVSRQINAGIQVAQTLASQGLIGPVVIVHLGTNGVRTLSEYQAIVDTINAAGGDHRIYWVNTRGEGWWQEVNANIDAVVAANGNVTLVDWFSYSNGHPEWFAADGIHLNADGAAAYAGLIKSAAGL